MLTSFYKYLCAAMFSIVLCFSALAFAQETESDSRNINPDQLELKNEPPSDSLQKLEEKAQETEQMLEEKAEVATDETEIAIENMAQEVKQEAESEVDEAVENTEKTATIIENQSESDDATSEEVISDDIVGDEDGQATAVISDDAPTSDEFVADDETTEQAVSDDVVTDDDLDEEQAETVVSDDLDNKQITTEKELISDDESSVEETAVVIESPEPAISTVIGCSDVCRDEKTGLPIKVLPRPFSNIYTDKNSEEIVDGFENVETFKPWYIKQRVDINLSDGTNPKGWYQVSTSIKDEPTGWMKAADVLEWHQALVMAYTHPGDFGEEQRSRVMMFSSINNLKEIVENSDREMKSNEYDEMLKNGKIPQGLISKEPEAYVSITDKFYMLPILDFDQVSIDGDDTMYLQIAAAVPQNRGVSNIQDPNIRRNLTQDPSKNLDLLKNIPVDIVFVMDMTASMQPYIDSTKEAIKQLSQRLTESKDSSMRDRIRFGLIGYRDSTTLVPELEFVSKNFTPELVDSDQLISILDTQAQAANVSSKGYAEDVFSGVATAIKDSAWNGKSLKVMILIGDSSGHVPGAKGASSEHAEEDLRQLASDRGIHMIAVHMNDQKHQEDAVIALKQYAALSRIEGSEYESALLSLDSTQRESFGKAALALGEKIDGKLQEIAEQGVQPSGAESNVVSEKSETVEDAAGAAYDKAFNAALVEYLGKETQPPRDFTAWVWDRDLKDPTVKALDVRVLLSKAQLNDMAVTMKTIRAAVQRAEITEQGFFEALQAVSVVIEKDPSKIANATNLAEAGLLPSFIESLPYKSDTLSMSDDQFAQMSAEERVQLDQSLRQKIAHYETISTGDEGWVMFNDSDPLNDQMYPLSINMLP